MLFWWEVCAGGIEAVLPACSSNICPASEWPKPRNHGSCSVVWSVVQGQCNVTYKIFLRDWSARKVVIAGRVTNHGIRMVLWQHNIAQIIIKSFTVRARLDNTWWPWVQWCWDCKTLHGPSWPWRGFVVRRMSSQLLHMVKRWFCTQKATSKGRS